MGFACTHAPSFWTLITFWAWTILDATSLVAFVGPTQGLVSLLGHPLGEHVLCLPARFPQAARLDAVPAVEAPERPAVLVIIGPSGAGLRCPFWFCDLD